MANHNDKIGFRIKELRTRLNLNQTNLAKQLGVTASAISQIESGGTEPSSALKQLICVIFNVNMEWLETGELPAVTQRAGVASKALGGSEGTYVNDVSVGYTPKGRDIGELINKTKDVLTSGNKVYSEALEENIIAFHRAVSVEEGTIPLPSGVGPPEAQAGQPDNPIYPPGAAENK